MSSKRKGAALKIKIPAFNGMMVAAIAAAIAACIYGTITLEGARKLPSDYSDQDSLLSEKQQLIDDLNSVPVAAPLPHSWQAVIAASKLAGVEMDPLDTQGPESGVATYTGPLKSWSGTLKGKPADVLVMIMKLQKDIPIFLYSYTVSSGQMKINFSVVGV